ncbi:hypothetical protein [Streptomyces sp. NPDC057910]|uniref:hypothetical protein n=1 Tax=Streptomyces sp. NPDC057910 TaxID=3346278 RepID=UPI001D3F6D8C|nr:hypothetical protein [Streptomyces sp. MAG02]
MFESPRQRNRRLSAENQALRDALAEEKQTTAAALGDLKMVAGINNSLCQLVARTITSGRMQSDNATAGVFADKLAEAVEGAGIDLSVELSWMAKATPGTLDVDGGSLAPMNLKRRLRLSEQARASLDEQLVALQVANERLYRAGDEVAS